jgi:2Fe-2S ferredoxin
MPVIHVTNRAGTPLTLEGKVGATLMEVLRDNNIDVEAICGGCCSCATCHVLVDKAWIAKLPPMTEDEQELVSQTESYDAAVSRLSCQIPLTAALDGITVTVAPGED